VGAGNGIEVAADAVAAKAGSGITVNSDGINVNTGYTTSGKNYKVQVDSTSGGLYVNVPWTDDTHYTNYLQINGNGTEAIKFTQDSNKSLNLKSSGSASISTGDGEITIHATDTTYERATFDTLGLVKSSVTGGVPNRDYSVQVNNDGTMRVNVPWLDANDTAETLEVEDLNPPASFSGRVIVGKVDGRELSFTMPAAPANDMCGYTSVPTYTSEYPLLAKSSTGSSLAEGKPYFVTSVTLKPKDGQITATSFYATSDRRKKENIKEFIPKKSILDLPVVEFDFKDSGSHQIGCIAQDLQEICPEIVNINDDGYLSINESKLSYLLLLELKKLREEFEAYKASKE
jgi:hypothetical protein